MKRSEAEGLQLDPLEFFPKQDILNEYRSRRCPGDAPNDAGVTFPWQSGSGDEAASWMLPY